MLPAPILFLSLMLAFAGFMIAFANWSALDDGGALGDRALLIRTQAESLPAEAHCLFQHLRSHECSARSPTVQSSQS